MGGRAHILSPVPRGIRPVGRGGKPGPIPRIEPVAPGDGCSSQDLPWALVRRARLGYNAGAGPMAGRCRINALPPAGGRRPDRLSYAEEHEEGRDDSKSNPAACAPAGYWQRLGCLRHAGGHRRGGGAGRGRGDGDPGGSRAHGADYGPYGRLAGLGGRGGGAQRRRGRDAPRGGRHRRVRLPDLRGRDVRQDQGQRGPRLQDVLRLVQRAHLQPGRLRGHRQAQPVRGAQDPRGHELAGGPRLHRGRDHGWPGHAALRAHQRRLGRSRSLGGGDPGDRGQVRLQPGQGQRGHHGRDGSAGRHNGRRQVDLQRRSRWS